MGPEGAINILYRKQIAEAKDPVAEGAKLADQYCDLFANPYRAAELGYIDAVIQPEETRRMVARSLEALKGKREKAPSKKHGNIPL